jgi:hypothetical protein
MPGKTGTNRATHERADNANACCMAGRTGQTYLFMIFDGMLPDIASILDALYLQLADQVFYGGVNAGSAQFQPIPCLFDQYQSMMHGVLCLLLPATPIRSSTMATRPEHTHRNGHRRQPHFPD